MVINGDAEINLLNAYLKNFEQNMDDLDALHAVINRGEELYCCCPIYCIKKTTKVKSFLRSLLQIIGKLYEKKTIPEEQISSAVLSFQKTLGVLYSTVLPDFWISALLGLVIQKKIYSPKLKKFTEGGNFQIMESKPASIATNSTLREFLLKSCSTETDLIFCTEILSFAFLDCLKIQSLPIHIPCQIVVSFFSHLQRGVQAELQLAQKCEIQNTNRIQMLKTVSGFENLTLLSGFFCQCHILNVISKATDPSKIFQCLNELWRALYESNAFSEMDSTLGVSKQIQKDIANLTLDRLLADGASGTDLKVNAADLLSTCLEVDISLYTEEDIGKQIFTKFLSLLEKELEPRLIGKIASTMIRRFSQLSSIDGLCEFLSLLKTDALRAVLTNEKVLKTFREQSAKLLPAEIVLHWESYNTFLEQQLEKNGIGKMSFLFISLSKMISSFPFEVDRDVAGDLINTTLGLTKETKGQAPDPIDVSSLLWSIQLWCIHLLKWELPKCLQERLKDTEDQIPDPTKEIIKDVEKAVASSLKRLCKNPSCRRSKNITKLLQAGSARVEQMMQNEPSVWTELPLPATPSDSFDLKELPEDEWKEFDRSREAWKDLKILLDEWTQKYDDWQNGDSKVSMNKSIICPSNVNHANPEFSVDKKFVFLWDRIRGEKEVIFRKIFDRIFFLLNSEECQLAQIMSILEALDGLTRTRKIARYSTSIWNESDEELPLVLRIIAVIWKKLRTIVDNKMIPIHQSTVQERHLFILLKLSQILFSLSKLIMKAKDQHYAVQRTARELVTSVLESLSQKSREKTIFAVSIRIYGLQVLTEGSLTIDNGGLASLPFVVSNLEDVSRTSAFLMKLDPALPLELSKLCRKLASICRETANDRAWHRWIACFAMLPLVNLHMELLQLPATKKDAQALRFVQKSTWDYFEALSQDHSGEALKRMLLRCMSDETKAFFNEMHSAFTKRFRYTGTV